MLEHGSGVTEFIVNGRFKLSAPKGWYNCHDPDVFLLLKNDAIDGSGIFIDYRQVEWLAADAGDHLADEAERFLNDSVIPNARSTFLEAGSISWSDGRVTSFRTLAKMSVEEDWVFQFVYDAATQTLVILHWNGDPSYIDSDVCPVIDTFTVLAQTSG